MASRWLTHAPQCRATSRSTGRRCGRPAIPGGTVCRYHGGAAPQVVKKAAERLTEARDDALGHLHAAVTTSGDQTDPRVLLDVVAKLTNLVLLLEGRATARTEQISRDGAAEAVRRIEELTARHQARQTVT